MALVEIVKDKEELGKKAAEVVVAQIKEKPNSVLGLLTGNTPLLMYQELVRACRAGRVSFAGVTTFNLDEYLGLLPDHKKSYHYYMQKNFFSKVDINHNRTFIPDGMAQNPEQEAKSYEAKIKKHGPIDLCILSIGRNGHIGFNEPGTEPNLPTHVVKLSQETLKINQGPEFAITMGISTILAPKKIILLAAGKEKAKAVRCALKGPISRNCPASYLQKHKNCTFLIDKEAALGL